MSANDVRRGVLHLLDQMRDEERAFSDGLSPDERAETGSSECWSARALIAHVTDFKREQAVRLEAACAGSEPPAFARVEHGDASLYATLTARPWPELSADADATTARLNSGVRALDDGQLTEPGRYAWLRGRALWAQVLVRGVWHPSAHVHAWYAERGRPDEALALQQRLLAAATDHRLPDAPGGRPFALYNLACAHALAGDADEALVRLAEALPLDPGLAASARNDPDLRSLQGTERFAELAGAGNR